MRWLVLLVVAGCYRDAPAPLVNRVRGEPHASSDVLAYLPGDAEIVMVLDVPQIRATPLWNKYEAAITRGAVTKLKAVCGIDAGSIQRITLAGRGAGAVIVIRGLPREPFMKCVADPRLIGTPVSVIGDVVTVTDGDDKLVMTFVDAQTLVIHVDQAASADTLVAIVRSGSPLRGNRAMAEMFVRADAGAPVWFFGAGSSRIFGGLGMGHRVAGAIGSIRVADGVDVAVWLRLDSQGAAQQVAASLKVQLAFTHPFVSSVDVVAEDDDVKIEVKVTDAEIDRLVAIMGLATALP